MNVKLIAHTALSEEFLAYLTEQEGENYYWEPIAPGKINPRAVVALTAIRTCYSPNKPSEVAALEGEKYFGREASDGGEGDDASRLFRHIVNSGHTSTLEHISYTFAVEGVSRALLAQLTRHRQLSFSVQSQRYVKFGSADKSGGFDYVTPPSMKGRPVPGTNRYDDSMSYYRKDELRAEEVYEGFMDSVQEIYDLLRAAGVPAEDARMVLPNATKCNLVVTGNLRAWLEFYSKRNPNTHAQWEIQDFSTQIRSEIVKVDPWVAEFFVA